MGLEIGTNVRGNLRKGETMYAVVQVDWAHEVVTVITNFTDLSDKGKIKKALVEAGYMRQKDELELGMPYFKESEPGCPPVTVVEQDSDFSKLL